MTSPKGKQKLKITIETEIDLEEWYASEEVFNENVFSLVCTAKGAAAIFTCPVKDIGVKLDFKTLRTEEYHYEKRQIKFDPTG